MFLYLLCLLGVSLAAGEVPRVPLSDGTSIPAIGLGTFLGFDENGQKQAAPGEVEAMMAVALAAGYRMFDTAALYKDEPQIGSAIAASGVPREEVYIITKLEGTKQRNVEEALQESLNTLNMSYVDLYLIHFPLSFKADGSYDDVDYVDTWRGMERAQRRGLARSVGVSNFNVSQLTRLLRHAEVRPVVLETEVNLNLAEPELLQFCASQNITVVGYTPFGSMFLADPTLPAPRPGDAALAAVAAKHKKTPAQIALRYLVQRGVIPIPKSSRKERIEENIDVFDFVLSEDEMSTLGKFNVNRRTVNPTFWQDHPYYPFPQSDANVPNPFIPKGAKKE